MSKLNFLRISKVKVFPYLGPKASDMKLKLNGFQGRGVFWVSIRSTTIAALPKISPQVFENSTQPPTVMEE